MSDSKFSKTGDAAWMQFTRARGQAPIPGAWTKWHGVSGANERFQLWALRGRLMRACSLIKVPQGWRGRHLTWEMGSVWCRALGSVWEQKAVPAQVGHSHVEWVNELERGTGGPNKLAPGLRRRRVWSSSRAVEVFSRESYTLLDCFWHGSCVWIELTGRQLSNQEGLEVSECYLAS